MKNSRTLILGLGNDILTDDAIGPRLVRDIKIKIQNPRVNFEEGSLGGLEVLELICGYDHAIIIDAIKTSGGTPGDVYMMNPDDFRETLHLSNFHDVSFLTALKLGDSLDMEMPASIDIIAVEIIEDLVFSESFTPELQLRYPEILAGIVNYLETELISQE